MRVIIIEDEPIIAEALKDEIINYDPSIEVLAVLDSIKSTIAFVHENGFPELFISDIELTDGLSFDIFKELNSTVPVIFCTAYNHYALEAFRVHGIDYILKPFDTDDIHQTLKKYETLFDSGSNQKVDLTAIAELILPKQEQISSILVHKRDTIVPIPSSDIALCYLDHKITFIQTFKNDKYPVNYTMDQLNQLIGDQFFRVNRQFIINRKAVKHVAQYFGRKLLVVPNIPFDEQLIVSKANSTLFLKWLEGR